MKRLAIRSIACLLLLLGCRGMAELPPVPATVEIVTEHPVIDLPLSGPVSEADAEISGMTWYKDWLILLPQYPSVAAGHLYAIAKADILAFLDGNREGQLSPQEIPSNAAALEELPNYEGVEAIAFDGENAYITIETDQGAEMMGYLVTGQIESDLSSLRLNAETVVSIPSQSSIDNYSDESVLFVNDEILTLYEANGENVNKAPIAHRFDPQLNRLKSVPFPVIEYRVTDATMPDASGRFWVINSIFEGSIGKLNPAPDPLVAQYGIGSTHAKHNIVERLVELQYTPEGVMLTGRPPIQLLLRSDGVARNWEGVARLDTRGFLLVTDKFPVTLLAFVPRMIKN